MTKDIKYNKKCPICHSSEFKQENGYHVCQSCGYKIPIKSVQKNWIKDGIFLFLMGVAYFLGLIIIELIKYGEIYFFNNSFNGIVTVSGTIGVIVGLISIIVGLCIKYKSSKK